MAPVKDLMGKVRNTLHGLRRTLYTIRRDSVGQSKYLCGYLVKPETLLRPAFFLFDLHLIRLYVGGRRTPPLRD
jgi:hypothetical protein